MKYNNVHPDPYTSRDYSPHSDTAESIQHWTHRLCPAAVGYAFSPRRSRAQAVYTPRPQNPHSATYCTSHPSISHRNNTARFPRPAAQTPWFWAAAELSKNETAKQFMGIFCRKFFIKSGYYNTSVPNCKILFRY